MPSAASSHTRPRRRVAAAFYGVVDETHEVLIETDLPNHREAMLVHSRFAGLTILSSLAFLNGAPSLAANAFFWEVLTPFSQRHGIGHRIAMHDAGAIAFVFDTLAWLCDVIGRQGRQHHARTAPAMNAVAAIARFKADTFHQAPRGPMRRWLGNDLRDHRGADWATDEHLATAAGDGGPTAPHRP